MKKAHFEMYKARNWGEGKRKKEWKYKVFTDKELGDLRTYYIAGMTWFVAEDIARMLHFSNPYRMCRRYMPSAYYCYVSINNRKSDDIYGGELLCAWYAVEDMTWEVPRTKKVVAEALRKFVNRIDRWYEHQAQKLASGLFQSKTFGSLKGYEEDGVAYLKLEDVARGLGLTNTQSINDVEYSNVRWNTVYKYLADFDVVPKRCDGDYKANCPQYIPENIFYRMAMKANNAMARRFQAWIADEVLPAIRKTGIYRLEREIEERRVAEASRNDGYWVPDNKVLGLYADHLYSSAEVDEMREKVKDLEETVRQKKDLEERLRMENRRLTDRVERLQSQVKEEGWP